MWRSFAASVLVAAVLALTLTTIQPVSAAEDDFAGVWVFEGGGADDATLSIELIGVDVYAVRLDFKMTNLCEGGIGVIVDNAAIAIGGVLNMDLVVEVCANGSLVVGSVFGHRTLTPEPDGTLTWSAPGGDATVLRYSTEFFDVLLGRFYTDAVTWLASEGITTGTSSTTFSPDDPVTRAQMATFLWRYDGRPEPASLDTPFTDVIAGTFYAKAVAWLAEANITTGTTPTTYSPGDSVTRAQMATFLWRYSGEPEPVSLESPFTDVVAGTFYEKAVAWLVEQGITTGTSPTTFSPDDPVTRGQMATFLWRLAGEPAV